MAKLEEEPGDWRPVTQRTLRHLAEGVGREMADQLGKRDVRLDKVEEAIGLLAKALERRS